MKSIVTLVASLILLSACATTGGVATDSYCVVAEPIFVSHQDALTVDTSRQILRENTKYKRLCPLPLSPTP